MKKIALLLAIVVLGTASFAAAPGKMAVGTALSFATLKYQFTKELAGSLGLNNMSGGASRTGILVKVDYDLAKAGQVQPSIGGYYSTDGAAAATSGFGITYGITTMVQPNLSLGADIILFSSTTFGGTSTTGILTAGGVGATLSASYYF